MAILLSDEEMEAMQGNCHFINNLYIFGIRRYMDYQSGIVGIKRRISYQSLREEMYIEPAKGIDRTESGCPTKPRLQRALKRLERIGLIEQIKNKYHLVFRCVLAKRDNSVQNIPDTKPIHFPDTKPDTHLHGKNPSNTVLPAYSTQQPDTKADTPQTPLADTPPLSGKAKEKELLRSSKKKCQLPQNFAVTTKHCEVAAENQWPAPMSEIDAFRDYHMARGTTMLDWDRAFYTWLRNAKKFAGGKQSGNYQSGTRPNAHSRAIENIINSAKGS